MSSIQPELWVDRPASAVEFYRSAFGARVLHQVGEGEDIVAQLSVDGAVYWVGRCSAELGRLSPTAAGGLTGRTLLVVDDPDRLTTQAVEAGATLSSPVQEEHGWRLGRIIDPHGQEWEIGRPPAGG